MEARFWLSQWKRFFRRGDAKVIDSHPIVQVMKTISKKARSTANAQGRGGRSV